MPSNPIKSQKREEWGKPIILRHLDALELIKNFESTGIIFVDPSKQHNNPVITNPSTPKC